MTIGDNFPRKKRGFIKRAYGTVKKMAPYAKVAYDAYNMAMSVKNLLNVEYKFIETVTSGTITTTPTIVLLTGIAQGDTQSTRNGNSLRARYVNMKYTITIDPDAGTSIVRVIMFRDKVSDGTVPTAGEVLNLASAIGNVAHYNVNNARSRFIIGYDRVHTLSINGVRGISGKFHRKVNQRIKYIGTDATQGSCNTNHYYLLLVSNEVAEPPTINASTTVSYVDN